MSGQVLTGGGAAAFGEIASGRALVCRRENHSSAGLGIIYSIILADGFLIECGGGVRGETRANILAEIINDAGPEKLSHAALGAA